MRRFLFLLFVGIAGTGVLIGLGTWQVQRLHWKQGVLHNINSRIDAPPVALPEVLEPDRDRYMPVQVSGTFLDQELHVLVSVKQVGAGVRIIAPFETTQGRRILVDRGFVAQGDLPVTLLTGPGQVTGNLHWPREIDGYTPEPDPKRNLWFARDVPAMAATLGTEPVLIVAKSQTDPAVTPLPVDTAAIPNDHLNYAITWYSLALIWAVMTGFFLRRGGARARE